MMNGYIKLNNGLVIPDRGFGTFSYKENLSDIIPRAIDVGYRLFDTSDDYQNQKYLGKALRQSKLNRSDYKIISKFSYPTHTYEFDKYLHNTLLQLFDDYYEPLDVLLMHWPYPHVFVSIWRAMESAYKKGLCRAIGVCNFKIEHLEKLRKRSEIQPMINQFEIHPLFVQKDVIDYCEKHNIKIMAYSPLARVDKRLFENDVLDQLALKKKKSISQIILRWNLQRNFVAIPAASSRMHIESNYAIDDFFLSEEEMSMINSLNKDMRVRLDPDTYFSNSQKIKYYAVDLYCRITRNNSSRIK